MRTIFAVALCLMVCLFPTDQAEAFAVQPQQMQPMLDQTFKNQRRRAVEAASVQAAKAAAAKEAEERKERSAQRMRTAMIWGAGLFGGFVVMRKLRS
jgi:hypothetical protein